MFQSSDIESIIQKIYPSAAFHKTTQIVFMTPRRTFLPSINTLACSKAEV